MDPTANLQDQINLANGIKTIADAGGDPLGEDSVQLAELVIALHDWIKGGGHLPQQWVTIRSYGERGYADTPGPKAPTRRRR